jgi:hypothetical protein
MRVTVRGTVVEIKSMICYEKRRTIRGESRESLRGKIENDPEATKWSREIEQRPGLKCEIRP